MKKKRNIWLKIGAVVIIIASCQTYLMRNYFVIGPGPVQKLEEMVTVETGKKDAKGSFLLTAVTSAPAGILSIIAAFISPNIDITRRAQEIPKGMDIDRYIEIMESLMMESQVVAGAVALKKFGFPTVVETIVKVEAILADSPAKGMLKHGDIILAVDGKRVSTADEAVKIIGQRDPGTEALLTVGRQGQIQRVYVGTGPHPEDSTRAAVGILVSSSFTYDLPLNIQIDSRNVKGSSAGLMFTLEILNQLDPTDLTGGQVIAGTGTISLDGTVGPISGIKQKLAAAQRGGAEYFLVPVENLASVQKALKRNTGIRIIGVHDINHALAILDDISRRNNGNSGEY